MRIAIKIQTDRGGGVHWVCIMSGFITTMYSLSIFLLSGALCSGARAGDDQITTRTHIDQAPNSES
jgi:hypothetical protein